MLNDFIMYNNIWLSGYDFIMNVGQNNRGTDITFKVGIQLNNLVCNDDGSVISATLNAINYINIYALSGSQNNRDRNFFFQEQIKIHLDLFYSLTSIIICDFNWVFLFYTRFPYIFK